jgi:pimeloyl-ACP methyl ester carboxylesterase
VTETVWLLPGCAAPRWAISRRPAGQHRITHFGDAVARPCVYNGHFVSIHLERCVYQLIRIVCAWLTALACSQALAQQPASLKAVVPPACKTTTCEGYDAIVFVHGIYGDEGTFKNTATGFDWPRNMPRKLREREVDIYRLDYQSALLSWAKQSNPSFKDVTAAFVAQLHRLRTKRYRSIGFIAHSLGGNLVSTYIHSIKTAQGHPERAQHAYVITLATPVLGSDIASIASPMKQLLQIDDGLLASLTKENLYLEMLLHFREAEDGKGNRYGCRRVNLHAAFERPRWAR